MRYVPLFLFCMAFVSTAPPALCQPADPAATRERVETLLEQMTLEEKVGQMTQLTLTTVAAEPSNGRGTVALDPAKLREALVERHVGSLINVYNDALSLEGWHALLTEIQDVATEETRLGIPVIYGIDHVHGSNYLIGGTVFPHNVGMAATFNRDLVRREGEITGDEAQAAGLPWNFAPVLDVGRQPLWPRFYETFGEDAYLAAELGAAVVEGTQRSGRVAATVKHYLGYSGPDSGRDRTPANLPERVVREQFLPPFRAAVEAGAKTVMINSGEINGAPVHASRYWLTEVLRDELGFEGVAVTDWEDVIFLHTRHRVAPTMKDAVRMAVEAGIDMSMTPYDYEFADLLVELVEEGTIPERRVDESVRRILMLKADLGLLDDPYPVAGTAVTSATEAHREAARQAARESITLLKNEGVLPLQPDARVAVVGPAADDLTALNGGWTYTWQGTDASHFPEDVPTLLDAIRTHAADVQYAEGASFTEAGELDAAARAAEAADVAVVALGETGYAEWVGDLDDLTLPDDQLRLAEAVLATGTPTVLVLLEGRPRLIDAIADDADAIVMGYWPGMEGGEALADVLYGEVNPSGRLPFTYPRHPNALLAYDHRYTETLGTGFDRAPDAFDPQFAFGHGLSYTTFAYSDLRLSTNEVGEGEEVTVEVTVTNTGERVGKDAVLLFTRQHYAQLTPAMRRLRGFEKIELAPGASQTVTFTLTTDDLTYVGQDGEPVLDPGAFDVMVGDRTATFEVER